MMQDVAIPAQTMRVKANIARMIAQGAPESDIDAYVASEGLSAEQLRGEPLNPDDPKTRALSDSFVPHGRTPSAGEKLAADEEVVFGFDEAPRTGFRFTADQEAEIMAAASQPGATPESVKAVAAKYLPGGMQINPEKYIEFAQQNPGAAPGALDYSRSDAAAEDAYKATLYRGFDQRPVEELRQNDVLPEGADAFARGAALELDDEIDGVVSTVLHGGTLDDNIAKARAIRDYDRKNHPGERIAGSIAGSLLLPTKFGGVFGKAGNVGRAAARIAYTDARAAGLGINEARALAQQAVRRAVITQTAKEGGLYGGGIGAAQADGGIGDRAIQGVEGAALGAGAGAGLGALGASRVSVPERGAPAPALNEGRQTLQAADRLGVDLVPADVGGALTRRASSAVGQSMGGKWIIDKAARTVEQGREARDRIAETFGAILDPVAAGEDLRTGVESAIRSTRDEARAFYASAEKASEGIRFDAPKAMAAIDGQISDLSEIPGGGIGLATLKGIRDRLKDGALTAQGVRGMRTVLRDQFLKDGLRGSDIERRVNQVIDAAARDVIAGLKAAGKGDAAAKFSKGDAAWRARTRLIDGVFQPIIGTPDRPRSAERIVGSLTADLRTNGARAVKLLNALPAEQQGNQRASIIGSLGGEGEAFSLAKFATEWKKIPKPTKRAYFRAEATAALDDLEKVALARKASEKYLNHPNTGGVNWALFNFITTLPTLGVNLAAQYGAGRLLSSARFTRWLARAPRSTLSTPAYIDRLSRIAKAEPAIANEVLQLQRRLNEAFSASGPARLAAEESRDGPGGVPQGNQQYGEYPGEELPQ